MMTKIKQRWSSLPVPPLHLIQTTSGFSQIVYQVEFRVCNFFIHIGQLNLAILQFYYIYNDI